MNALAPVHTPEGEQRSVPHNLEAEQALIGAVLMNNDAFDVVRLMIRPQHFHEALHGRIWAAIARFREQGLPITPVTLKTEFEGEQDIGDVSVPGYLARLATGATTVINADGYAQLIVDLAARRSLIGIGQEIVSRAYEAPMDDKPDGMAAEAIRELDDVVAASQWGRPTGLWLRDATPAVLALAEGRATHARLVPTGLDDLDRMIGGFPVGSTSIIAGRTAMGKTTMGTCVGRNIARTGKGVVYLSLEMPSEDLSARFISDDAFTHTGIQCPYGKMLRGELDLHELDRVRESSDRINELPLIIDRSRGINLEQAGALIRRYKAGMLRQGVKLEAVILDHIGLMGSVRTRKSLYEEVTENSHGLLKIAGDEDVAMIVLAQISREVEKEHSLVKKRPRLDHLRECLTADAWLTDADSGDLISIRDVQSGQRVLSMDERNQKIVPARVSSSWSTGQRTVFKVTTKSGRTVTATSNHPFFTDGGWKALDQLSVGDSVAFHMGGHNPPGHDGLPPDLCRLLGLMVGDGTYKAGRSVEFVANERDAEVVEDFKAIVRHHFPECQFREWSRNGGLHVSVTCTNAEGHGRPYGNPFREWLRELGVLGQDFRTKSVPDVVFRSGPEGISHFILGYLQTDGTVKLAIRKTWRVSFSSCSKRLLDQVQLLLDRFGIPSNRQKPAFDIRFRSHPLHTLAISSHSEALNRLQAVIPPLYRKGRALHAISPPIGSTSPGCFALPGAVSRYLARASRAAGLHWTETWRDQGKQTRRDTAREWADKLDDEYLQTLADSDLRWDNVKSIEEAGTQQVYDLTVEGTHSFVANGFVVHNSGHLEQDARLVLLMFRQAHYLQQSLKDAIASRDQEKIDDLETRLAESKHDLEVIVAKQNNGPTGAVHLWCDMPNSAIRLKARGR